MGAWGTGSFENDGALDFLADYREGGARVVKAAFESAMNAEKEKYLEVYFGQSVIAASETVAACNGKRSAKLSEQVISALSAFEADVRNDADLVEAALKSLPLVMSSKSSEIYELWEEAAPEDFAEFKGDVADLMLRLREI